MTPVTRRVMCFTVAATFSGVTLAHAQFVDPLEFTTTFAFSVGHTRLPAGRYEIRRDEDDPALYRIQARSHQQAGTFFAVEPASLRKAPDKSEIVFMNDGEGYVLESVWEEGSADGVESVSAETEKRHLDHTVARAEARVPARLLARNANGDHPDQ
jgi:hypothetical protein